MTQVHTTDVHQKRKTRQIAGAVKTQFGIKHNTGQVQKKYLFTNESFKHITVTLLQDEIEIPSVHNHGVCM